MTIPFVKAEAAGNDFVVITDPAVAARSSASLARLARVVCRRHYGVGADGLLVLSVAQGEASFRMRIFNPDGSEADMCGNGIRCAARVWQVQKRTGARVRIKTRAGIQEARVRGGVVSVRMADPRAFSVEKKLAVDGKKYILYTINTGVPHAVVFVRDLERVDVAQVGRAIRRHPRFAPDGTNVNFVARCGVRDIRVRTYERGVEAETLACGTGATAAALISARVYRLRSLVRVHTRGGEVMTITFGTAAGGYLPVVMSGTARIVYTGRIEHV